MDNRKKFEMYLLRPQLVLIAWNLQKVEIWDDSEMVARKMTGNWRNCKKSVGKIFVRLGH